LVRLRSEKASDRAITLCDEMIKECEEIKKVLDKRLVEIRDENPSMR